MDSVSMQVAGKALVLKVDVDKEPKLAAQFGVRSIPTLVILRQGKVTQQFVGVQQADDLVRALATP